MMKLLLMSILITLDMKSISIILTLSLMSFYLCFMNNWNCSWGLMYDGFYMDNISYWMTLLSVWVTLLMILTVSFNVQTYLSLSNILMSYLLFFLISAFNVSSLIMFYISFETCLILTLFMVIGWGYQSERISAGNYMVLYTVLSSLPFLCILSFLKYSEGVMYLNTLESLIMHYYMNWSLSVIYLLSMLSAFMVKLPVYSIHLWLPKAHVEAPVNGSMILAGLMLKLGGYGLLRLMKMTGWLMESMSSLLMSWSIFGGVVAGILCMFQKDMKKLVALSSVSHMALIVSSLMTQSIYGLHGSLLIMIGHGLCSSGLFFFCGVMYNNTKSRSIKMNKGLYLYNSSMNFFFFLMISSNMSAPPSLNLLGEMNSIMAVMTWSSNFGILLMLMVFLSAAYSLYLYANTSYGKKNNMTIKIKMNLNEIIVMFMHWIPLNSMFLLDLM